MDDQTGRHLTLTVRPIEILKVSLKSHLNVTHTGFMYSSIFKIVHGDSLICREMDLVVLTKILKSKIRQIV